jgi:hypothetical protein
VTIMPELGSLVAIPVPWKHSASGCVEWRLVDWTIEGDGHPRYPVLDDGHGSEDEDGRPIAWAGDYAIRDRRGTWHFPDDERCDDEGLLEAFRRRGAPPETTP